MVRSAPFDVGSDVVVGSVLRSSNAYKTNRINMPHIGSGDETAVGLYQMRSGFVQVESGGGPVGQSFDCFA